VSTTYFSFFLSLSIIQLSSQFYDLIEIFRIGGYAPHTNYLFLGQSLSYPLSLSLIPPQRRLRRPWPLQRRNNISPYLSQTSLPRQSPINPWQSRIKGCNSSQPPLIHVCGAPLSLKYSNLDLWVLYGMCPQIRLITCMDLFHRHVRLLNPVRRNR
jgi:hypothetical protein